MQRSVVVTEEMIKKAICLADVYMNEIHEDGYNSAELCSKDEKVQVEIEVYSRVDGKFCSDYWTEPYFYGEIFNYPEKIVAFFYDEENDDWIERDITNKFKKNRMYC